MADKQSKAVEGYLKKLKVDASVKDVEGGVAISTEDGWACKIYGESISEAHVKDALARRPKKEKAVKEDKKAEKAA